MIITAAEYVRVAYLAHKEEIEQALNIVEHTLIEKGRIVSQTRVKISCTPEARRLVVAILEYRGYRVEVDGASMYVNPDPSITAETLAAIIDETPGPSPLPPRDADAAPRTS